MKWLLLIPMVAFVTPISRNDQERQSGKDRATCILQVRNVQQAVRSYQNMNGIDIGAKIDWNEIFGPNRFLENRPACPGGGTYTFSEIFPKVGSLACACSIRGHQPDNFNDW